MSEVDGEVESGVLLRSASERGGANGSHAPPPPPLTLMFLGSEMDDAKKGECHGWCW